MSNDQDITRGRWDIYGPVHKGLRLAHGQISQRLGAADWTTVDQSNLLADLRNHLRLAGSHLAHEDQHIHPILESLDAGVEADLSDQHDHHRARFATLDAQIASFEAGAVQDRETLGRALYHGFSLLVAEDLEHMHHEETVVWPRLCALLTDEELRQIEMSIVAELRPEDTIAFMSSMLPAMNRMERAELLAGMKAAAPPEAFAAVLDLAARPTLSCEDWADLQDRGLAA